MEFQIDDNSTAYKGTTYSPPYSRLDPRKVDIFYDRFDNGGAVAGGPSATVYFHLALALALIPFICMLLIKCLRKRECITASTENSLTDVFTTSLQQHQFSPTTRANAASRLGGHHY